MDKQVLRRQDDATRGSEADDMAQNCSDFACTFRITTVAYMDADVDIGPKRPSPSHQLDEKLRGSLGMPSALHIFLRQH
jgi:hypothetical protein